MNFTSGQYKNQSRHGAFAGRDWNALEKRLNETKELLKEILANLQLVLHNLRGVNRLNRTQTASGPNESGFGRTGGAKGSSSFANSAGSSNFAGSANSAGSEAFTRVRRENAQGTFGQGAQTNKFKTAQPGFRRASAFSAEPGGFERDARGPKNPYARSETQGAGHSAYNSESASRDRAGQKTREASSAGSQNNAGAKANAAGGASSKQFKSQAGSSRREYRRPFRPRGEMTLERARDILCLSSTGCVGEIKSAYRKKARLFHPDLGGDEEMMKDLNLAYDLLLQYHFSHQAPTERNQ